jgi:hypothetical protein
MTEAEANAAPCPYCGHRGAVVEVHGHGQCSNCGTNFEPCCAGADAAEEAGSTTAVNAAEEPQLFARLFVQLGGAKATVTTEALLFALVQRLGTDLDDAKIVLEAGERIGIVQRVGASCHRLRRNGSSQAAPVVDRGGSPP